MGIRDYLTDPSRSGDIRQAIGRAFRHRRRGGDYRPRIVVVVGDAAARGNLVTALGGAAYTVTVAANPHQALELCGGLDVDIVLTDAHATTREGTALLSLLRRRFPDLKTVALVAASTLENAAVAEATDTLSIGVDAPHLLDAIERLLGAD